MESIEDQTLELDERLELARAEQAEAVRRAHHLRAVGSWVDIEHAMRDVDATHSHVARLQKELGSWKTA